MRSARAADSATCRASPRAIQLPPQANIFSKERYSAALCSFTPPVGMNRTCGLIVNSSRAIIYADPSENFAATAAEKAREVQQQMAAQLQNL